MFGGAGFVEYLCRRHRRGDIKGRFFYHTYIFEGMDQIVISAVFSWSGCRQGLCRIYLDNI